MSRAFKPILLICLFLAGLNPLAAEHGREFVRLDAQQQPGQPEFSRIDAAVLNGLQTPANGFNFWEFRHGRVI